ncbi:MAG: hypothetical protein V1269_18370, partial [Deltaproteobacteria bacterium]|nr:hypothetical protein [Deltaproteobacteria bacterium]
YDSRNISLEPEISGELGKVQCLWGTPQWNLEEVLQNWTRQLMVRQQFDDALVYSRMLHIAGYSRPRWPPTSQDQKLDPELTVRIWDETGNLEDQIGTLLSSVAEWSAIPTRFQNDLKRVGSEEFSLPFLESSQGWVRIDHNRLAGIIQGIPGGKLHYELGLAKVQGPEPDSACLQGYRYARNPIGRPFARGFQRCWDHPLEKDDLNQFLLFILEETILLQDADPKTGNPILQQTAAESKLPHFSKTGAFAHSGYQDLQDWVELREYHLCLEQGGCLDQDSRIEEDPTEILEPKTEFQTWLKGVSGQGVFPPEMRTDPGGIEIYRNCIEQAECGDPSITGILSGSKQVLMDSFDAERYCSWLGGRLPGPGYALWHHLQGADQAHQKIWVKWQGKTLLASYDSRNISLEPEISG